MIPTLAGSAGSSAAPTTQPGTSPTAAASPAADSQRSPAPASPARPMSDAPSSSPVTPPQPVASEEPLDVEEFLENPPPPTRPTSSSHGARGAAAATAASAPFAPASPPPPAIPWTKRMFLALLDPRAIQWLLVVGGGLMVIGIIIWLASLKVFENPYVVAGALGIGSLAVHVAGGATMLKTRHRTAGRALTFLGCVVLPLNLWYYEYQDILSLEGNLWMAAFVICWIFIGTVYILRDPLFIFAVEAGITLTAMLLMASLGHLDDATYLSLTLLALAVVSIHAQRAFPADAPVFSRDTFGLNLFWSGHVQLAAALGFLAAAQLIDRVTAPSVSILGIRWSETLVTDSKYVAGAIWLAGMYLYVYSDLAVRRIGVYTYLAAICLMMAEVTIVGLDVPLEALIALMTVTAVGVNVALTMAGEGAERMRRTLPPLSLLVSFLAVGIGIVLHIRTTSHSFAEFGWGYSTTGWSFVGAMLIVAIGNRVSAFLDRHRSPPYALNYILFSATGLIIGAAGLLRNLELNEWHQQAPLLMIIPIVYLLASILRTERSVRGPLQWAAHGATVVIMGSIVISSVEVVKDVLQPISREPVNLLAGLVFLEATVFYTLAAIIRRKQLNVYFATIAGCGAVWEFMGYFHLPSSYYTLLYAVLGLALLIASRMAGIAERAIFKKDGEKSLEVTGPGSSFYIVGNAVLVMAFLAAALQGISRLVAHQSNWEHMVALVLTTVSGAVATLLTRSGPQRWWHATGTIVLAALTFLTFNVLLDIPIWRKAEVFAVLAGLAILAASYIARFREKQDEDLVTIGLWLGSAIVSLTLLITVLSFRVSTGPSFRDEIALLTITMLMLASGSSLQFKAPTLFGGGALGLYLAIVIAKLAYDPQVAIGIYLAIGGSLVFVVGVVLSIYRDRLIALPDRIAKREGLFRIINWR